MGAPPDGGALGKCLYCQCLKPGLNVVPIPKGMLSADATQYRPISILPFYTSLVRNAKFKLLSIIIPRCRNSVTHSTLEPLKNTSGND